MVVTDIHFSYLPLGIGSGMAQCGSAPFADNSADFLNGNNGDSPPNCLQAMSIMTSASPTGLAAVCVEKIVSGGILAHEDGETTATLRNSSLAAVMHHLLPTSLNAIRLIEGAGTTTCPRHAM